MKSWQNKVNKCILRVFKYIMGWKFNVDSNKKKTYTWENLLSRIMIIQFCVKYTNVSSYKM